MLKSNPNQTSKITQNIIKHNTISNSSIFTVNNKPVMGNCLCCCLKENLSLKVSSIYDIAMKDIHQNLIDFSQYRNKVLLIVNIACK